MSEETNQPEESPAPTKRGKLPLVLALVVGLTVGALAGSVLIGPLVADGTSGSEAAECACEGETAEGEEGEGDGHGAAATAAKPVHTVADLVLNPAQSNGSRYLVLTVAFSVRDSTIVGRMAERDPEVRDVLLKVLGAKTVDQLTDLAGRPALKEEIRAQVVRLFGEKSVQDIFFPQFVVQ